MALGPNGYAAYLLLLLNGAYFQHSFQIRLIPLKNVAFGTDICYTKLNYVTDNHT